MKLFNVGAMRPATDDARFAAASDLVQRTLAQHGLSGRGGQNALPHTFNMPSLDGMLAQFSQPADSSGASKVDVPQGAQFHNDTFICDAGTRTFRTYVPASALDGAAGVVMMLHGCTQTPDDFAAGTGMNALAEVHRFIVVYPAQSRGDNAQSCWNWFSRGDQRRGRGEPAILAGITAQVCAEYGVGRDRTFVAGLSAGAAMAAILGETYPDVFAAVGAHSGLAVGSARDVASAFAAMGGNALDGPTPTERGAAVRSIVFHGSADGTVHPSNGDQIVRRALDATARQSVEAVEHGQTGGRDFTRKVSSDAQGDPVVEHWTVKGQGHAWSGGQSAGSYTDTSGPDASAEMIRFFFNTPDKDS
ncbi:MAG: PHB depolymerase family esterase [Sulfitobacter sp.]